MATRRRTKVETVTIRGRVSTVLLARGQKVTVTLTPEVQRLLDAGYVERVE